MAHPRSAAVRTCIRSAVAALGVLSVVGCAEIQAWNERVMYESSPQGQCELGDANACVALGFDVQDGRLKAPPTAVSWFEKGCALGSLSSCNSAGWHHHKGLSGPVDEAAAFRFFALSCPESTPDDGKDIDDGARYGCGNLGYMYEMGLGVERDYVLAVKSYAKSCAAKMTASCFSLGIGYERGRGIDKDEARARELYAFACDGGDDAACGNLGVMVMDGRGGAVDYPRAHALLEAACAKDNAWACTSWGYAFANGVGVAQDGCRARALHEKACGLKNTLGCANLGASLLGSSCGAPDVKRGRPLVEKACAETADACGALGDLLADEGDVAGALAAYERGCDDGDAHACLRWGVAARDGRGTPKDPALALQRFERSCSIGRPDGCKEALKSAKQLKSPNLSAIAARACAMGVGGC